MDVSYNTIFDLRQFCCQPEANGKFDRIALPANIDSPLINMLEVTRCLIADPTCSLARWVGAEAPDHWNGPMVSPTTFPANRLVLVSVKNRLTESKRGEGFKHRQSFSVRRDAASVHRGLTLYPR